MDDIEKLITACEALEKIASDHAKAVGPLHAWWDVIFDARDAIKRAKALEGSCKPYKASWHILGEPLMWMHDNPKLKAYWGWNLADIANDLIDRAYPGLRKAK